jgi:hypothetical protein
MAGAEKKSLLLRLDRGGDRRIESLAAQELRSINGQIEWLLREALAKRGREVKTTTRTNSRRP